MTPLERATLDYEHKYVLIVLSQHGLDRIEAIALLTQVIEMSIDDEVTWKTGVRMDKKLHQPGVNPQKIGPEAFAYFMEEWTEGDDDSTDPEKWSYAKKWREGIYVPTLQR